MAVILHIRGSVREWIFRNHNWLIECYKLALGLLLHCSVQMEQHLGGGGEDEGVGGTAKKYQFSICFLGSIQTLKGAYAAALLRAKQRVRDEERRREVQESKAKGQLGREHSSSVPQLREERAAKKKWIQKRRITDMCVLRSFYKRKCLYYRWQEISMIYIISYVHFLCTAACSLTGHCYLNIWNFASEASFLCNQRVK